MNRIASFFENDLKERGLYGQVSKWNVLVGDIHNHCGISYGYGSIENAIAFACTQLDFFSVTGHFAWPDMEDDPLKKIPQDVVDYHKAGFRKLRANWDHYKECMKACASSGIVPFLSYEYHSFKYGDYTILCNDIGAELPDEVADGCADDRLDHLLSGTEEQCERFFCTPHHIGYKTGYRGINWDYFNSAVSPVVEIISMHGCAESHEARQKYLHTMGPKSDGNTYQGGLARGLHFGVVGSTDHHNAAPGSYGFGRTVLYTEDTSRGGIWTAIRERRTAAASGDPIETALFVNGVGSGFETAACDGRARFDGYVCGYDKLDCVEIIHDGHVVSGRYGFDGNEEGDSGFVSFMFGWGKKHKPAVWDVRLKIVGGTLNGASPRLRGIDMVDPLDIPNDAGGVLPAFKVGADEVCLHVVTDGNATAVTDSTQGFVVDVDASSETVFILDVDVSWDGRNIFKHYVYDRTDLNNGKNTEYVDGFVSPALEIGCFRPRSICSCHISGMLDVASGDSVYMRAYQENGDAVFTSPVFIV